jgi:4-hydroxybenzoate polyprenyltransferase
MAICGLLLWLYSNYLKRTILWGNIAIAFLSFSTLAMLALFYERHVNAILFFAFFAFLLTLIRELIKDIEDTKGDEAFGCKTFPIVFGLLKTKQLIYALCFTTSMVLIASILVINFNLYLFFIFFSIVPIIYLAYLLHKAERSIDFTQLSNYAKSLMVVGIIGMVFV